MKQILVGSINYTKLADAISRGEVNTWVNNKGETLINCSVFVDTDGDQFGNTMSVKANPVKDHFDHKVYLGNFKPVTKKQGNG